MVVQTHVTHQRLLQVLAAAEAVCLQDVRYAAIETLHHPVGFGLPGLGQPVLYTERLAQLVKLMVATGLALSGCKEPIRELNHPGFRRGWLV